MKIIPAVLPKDFREIEDKVALVKGLSDFVQVDICDGKFVPQPSWPYKKQDSNFESIVREERGMPEWEDIDYEFDLMVANLTEDDMRKWLSTGATSLVLHVESSADLTHLIKVIEGLVEIGLALKISTPISEIEKYKDTISFIQLMGIDRIGFQSQPFDEKVLEKIREVKKAYPSIPVQIDGGVNKETAVALKEAGADRLIVGSALFNSENIVDTYRSLEEI